MGVVIYLWIIDENKVVYCLFVMGKLRVVLFKLMIIFRMEFVVVILVVKLSKLVDD